MFINKPLQLPKATEKSYSIDTSGGLDMLSSKYSMDSNKYSLAYNLTVKGQRLFSSCGADVLEKIEGQPVEQLKNARAMWYFDGENGGEYIIHSSDNKLYRYELDSKSIVCLTNIPVDRHLNCTVFDLGQVKCMVLFNDDTFLLYKNGNIAQLPVPSMDIATIHNERLFGAKTGENTLHFSAPMDISNWTQSVKKAGYVKLSKEKGAITGLVSYDDYLYVFRQYGIERLETSYEQKDFTITDINTDCGTILSGSVQICGKYVYFMSDSGLYRFDGNKAEKTFLQLDGVFEKNQQNVKSYFADNVYYLAIKAKFNDDIHILCEKGNYINNALLAVNLAQQSYTILRGFDTVNISKDKTDNVLLAIRDNDICNLVNLSDSGQCVGQNMIARWHSGKLSLGANEKNKFVDNITLYTKYNLEVTLIADGKKINRYIKGSCGVQKVPFKQKGKEFELMLTAMNGKADITLYSLQYCQI